MSIKKESRRDEINLKRLQFKINLFDKFPIKDKLTEIYRKLLELEMNK